MCFMGERTMWLCWFSVQYNEFIAVNSVQYIFINDGLVAKSKTAVVICVR